MIKSIAENAEKCREAGFERGEFGDSIQKKNGHCGELLATNSIPFQERGKFKTGLLISPLQGLLSSSHDSKSKFVVIARSGF